MSTLVVVGHCNLGKNMNRHVSNLPQPHSAAFSTVEAADTDIAPVSTSPTSDAHGSSPLDAFRDPVDRQTRTTVPVGRPWSVQELRRKSYDDLHKLWYVLYKEKNMLLTEQQLSRTRQLVFPQPERLKKVKRSMQQIKHVLGERKQVKLKEHRENMLQQQLEEGENDDEGEEDAETGMSKDLK